MTYRTLDTTLRPDGRVDLDPAELPERPFRVMLTFLEAEDEQLMELGDCHERLIDYEDRLARGEITWQ